ncbi:MAG: class I SAM-dependent methyltransferase [Candidatus Bathyarchaeota archaeon]|nr:MAG: class I SAM-dependent methyltransferase [Candidatus Bathyarchaeota archaeon]
MKKQDQLWTQAYLKLKSQWKLEPNWKLIEYLHLVPQGPVLDLGAGNGRNALFFAELGHEVDYVDISKTYSRRMRDRAKDENLELTAHNMDIRDFEVPEKHYVLIIASKILQLFPNADIEKITRKMNAGLARKGLIYVYTFSVENLKHSKRLHELEQVEENTYYHRKHRQHFHYFKSDELLSHFSKLRMIFYNEDSVHNLKKRNSRYLFVLEYLGQRIR